MKKDSQFEVTLRMLETLQTACGLHTRREKLCLWNLARQVQEGAVVEIGSFHGYSTILLAKALADHGKVYAIDPHSGKMCESDVSEACSAGDTWLSFNENIQQASVSHMVCGLKMKSEEAAHDWKHPVGLLWIDGSHKYEDVKKDFLFWQCHLTPGGRVVFHDIWSPGVGKVVIDHLLRDRAFGDFRFVPCCMFYATYLSNRHYDVLTRSFWRLILMLSRIVCKRPTLGYKLSHILRKIYK